jgi:DNA-binding NarL/FixJ family response regulator
VRSSPTRQTEFGTLSDVELRILAGLASGRTYAEIAAPLGFKPKTVKNKGLVLLRKVSPDRRRVDATARLVRVALPYLDPSVVRRTQEFLASVELSDSHKELLRLLAGAHTSSEIAAALGVAEKTAKNYVSQVMKKLQTSNRVSAAMLWVIAENNRSET